MWLMTNLIDIGWPLPEAQAWDEARFEIKDFILV